MNRAVVEHVTSSVCALAAHDDPDLVAARSRARRVHAHDHRYQVAPDIDALGIGGMRRLAIQDVLALPQSTGHLVDVLGLDLLPVGERAHVLRYLSERGRRDVRVVV